MPHPKVIHWRRNPCQMVRRYKHPLEMTTEKDKVSCTFCKALIRGTFVPAHKAIHFTPNPCRIVYERGTQDPNEVTCTFCKKRSKE